MSRDDNTSLVELPSQWHDDATTADNFGPATYSLTLNMASSDDPTQRQHLVLDGVMNQAYEFRQLKQLHLLLSFRIRI